MLLSAVYEWLGEHWNDGVRDVVLPLVAAIILFVGYIFRKSFSSVLQIVIRRLRWRHTYLQHALEKFEGKVEIVDKRRLSHRAGRDRIKQFYEGGKVHWDVIAANADIGRDKEKELLDALRTVQQGLRIVCIVAGPDEGKSTLAWRAAANLYQEHKAIVIRAKQGDDPQLWYRLSEFSELIRRRPFFILADDLFRKDEVVDVLKALDPAMPITILATSQLSEFHCHGFTCRIVEVGLESATPGEESRMLTVCGKKKEELARDQRRRLEKAASFGDMVEEVTGGEGHTKASERTVEQLKSKDPIAYGAYKYVCFCSQYDVSVPSEVLDRLDSEGRYHRLAHRRTVQGLMSEDDAHPGAFRATWNSKKTAVQFRSYQRAPHIVLLEIANAVDPAHDGSRRFLTFLVLTIARVDPDSLAPGREELIGLLKSIRPQATGFTEVRLWATCFSELGVPEEVEACEEALLSTSPANSWECVHLAGLLDSQHRQQAALDVLNDYVGRHPSEGHARPMYLGILEQCGTRDQIKEAMRETRQWLARHSEDSYVRTVFLGFVERNLPAKGLIEEVFRETCEWLLEHPEDHCVRTAFLGFVERNIPAKGLIEETFKETREWLAEHPEDNFVRTAFLGFVERNKGPKGLIWDTLKRTRKWLAEHPEDNEVRTAFLGFVQRNVGSKELIRDILRETHEWFARHPGDRNVRIGFLRLVEKQAPEIIPRIMDEMEKWLIDDRTDSHMRMAIMSLVRCHGSDRQLRQLVESLRKALAVRSQSGDALATLFDLVIGDKDLEEEFEAELHGGIVKNGAAAIAEMWQTDPNKQVLFARWLTNAGYLEDAERIYKSILAVAPNQTTRLILRQAHYNYGNLLLQLERFPQAANQFRKVLDAHNKHVAAQKMCVRALRLAGSAADERGDGAEASKCYQQAKVELEAMLHWPEARKKEVDVAPIYAEKGWLHIACGEYEQSITAFEKANRQAGGGHWNNYWGIGKALVALERFDEAILALRQALRMGPQDLQPPASDEIADLLRQCQEALAGDKGIANDGGA